MGVELIQVAQETYNASKRLEKSTNALYKMGEEKARSERDYRVALAQEMLRLKSEGMSVTLIPDVAKGNVGDKLFERDAAEAKFKAAIESVDAIKTQVSALQSILRYQDSL